MKNQEGSVARNWTYVSISIVVIAVLAMLVLYFPALHTFDKNVLHSVRLALSPYPTSIPTFVSTFGYTPNLLWPLLVAGGVMISHQKYLKYFLLVFFTQATFAVTAFIKDFICRERPTAYHGYSFPSMHSASIMCFCGILIYLTSRYVKSDFWRNFIIIVLGLWIFMTGVSRMWLGVHYLTDVIAGMFLGFLMVNLYIIVSKFLSK